MSKSSDTAMAMEYRKGLIQKNMSIDICKECTDAVVTDNKLKCKAEMPDPESCNLLKIFYNI